MMRDVGDFLLSVVNCRNQHELSPLPGIWPAQWVNALWVGVTNRSGWLRLCICLYSCECTVMGSKWLSLLMYLPQRFLRFTSGNTAAHTS